MCRCVTVADDCPPDGDILYGPDLIDIRKQLTCTGFVCCTAIMSVDEATIQTSPSPTSETKEHCACVDRINECPVHYAVLPQFVGPQCGPPRVWCCPPDISNDVTIASGLMTTPMPPQTSGAGPWCQCAPAGTCSSLRVGGELASSVCGDERMELCCHQNNGQGTTPIQPLTSCRFSSRPTFPAEGTCSCTTRNHCRQPARFAVATQVRIYI
jgi:hypothetical protein